MSATAKAQEPTMEEILASIRRIISDDDPAAAKGGAKGPAAKPAPEPAPEPAQDLGQDDIDAMFAAMDAGPEPAPEPKESVGIGDDLDVLELTDEVAETPAPEEPEPVKAAPPPPQPPQQSEPPRASSLPAAPDRLLSPGADEAVQSAFGTLAHTILAGNARTLDDIVREMLRPMLRAWLDDNLPPLVERLVRQEIERVARGGR
jgi:cell pole-organizing protein PopZ